MQGVTAKHRALGRSIVKIARDPALISLSLPIDSIPILGPLGSPLIGGGDSGGAQPHTPQPPSITSPGSGNGGGHGNGNGNGNGNGGSGNGNGGGSPPTPTSPPTSGGATAIPPVPIVPSPTSPTSADGKPSGPPSASNTSKGSSTASSSSASSVGNFMGIGSGGSIPVNVGSGFSTSDSAVSAMSTLAAPETDSPPLSQSSQSYGSNTVDTSSPFPTITTATAASSGKQLSGGVIAGITIVCLFFLLALTLLVIRRRSIAHRVKLRTQWWSGHNASDGSFSFASGIRRSPTGSNGESPASRLSSRSSFATNFDQGLALRIDPSQRFSLGTLPDLPPMAEVHERNSALISTGSAVARRESLNSVSVLSSDSEPDAQYLSTFVNQSDLGPLTPMLVHPFSPSESFAFPKPPAPSSSTADSFLIPGTHGPASSQSSATLVHLSTPPPAFMADFPPASLSTPYLHPQLSAPSATFLPFVPAASPSVDPFADPAKAGFSDVETIRRIFTPSLEDELAVHPGDRVHPLRIFDDGWAFVEKLRGTGERYERGLIPLDCFREASQALPTFLAEKRISYGSQKSMVVAL